MAVVSNKELNLFLEEVCCDLIRFRPAVGGAAGRIARVRREVPLGAGRLFADILVEPPDEHPFLVEIKWGRPTAEIISRVGDKYASLDHRPATHLVVVTDRNGRADFDLLADQLAQRLGASMKLEFWTEQHLAAMAKEVLGAEWPDMSPASLSSIRWATQQAQREAAFGPGARYTSTAATVVQHSLLWHFGWWRLAEVRAGVEGSRAADPTAELELVPAGVYKDAVIVMADICSFTAFMRDTRDERVIREAATMFYSLSRSEIIDHGGMLYEFLGDGVIGVFGVPDKPHDYAEKAVAAARGLVNAGRSVAEYWQRHIDREQSKHGVHVGLAIGDLQVLPLRPFSRTRMGMLGDSINLASRLMDSAGESEILISNTLYNRLASGEREPFTQADTIEAKNAGPLRAWRLRQAPVA